MLFFFLFFLAAKLIGLRTGCQLFRKRLVFSTPTPLIQWSHLRGVRDDFGDRFCRTV